MRYLQLSAFGLVLMLFWGCAEPIPSDLTRDVSLKAPNEPRVLIDMNTVAFEWDRLDDPIVEGYILYRGQPEENLSRIGGVPNRFASHYTDTDSLTPETVYIYRLSYYTIDGRESPPSPNVRAQTLPTPSPVSFIRSVPGLPRMGKLVFRPHPSERISHYTIQRRDQRDRQWREVGRLQGRLHAEFIDYDLADDMEYEYRIIAHTHDGLSTAPSDIVITATRPLPPAPQGLSATRDLPRSIQLNWQRLDGDEPGHYRLYASNHPGRGFNKIAELEAVSGATETLERDGQKRYYKITFVDRDGLESPLPQQAIEGQSLPKPQPPRLTGLTHEDGGVSIRWESRDARNERFEVVRHRVSGPLLRDETRFKSDASPLLDRSVEPGVTYQYEVLGIDTHGIRSEPSGVMRTTIEDSGV
jgi:fibronectin type 3 domain-containing protein